MSAKSLTEQVVAAVEAQWADLPPGAVREDYRLVMHATMWVRLLQEGRRSDDPRHPASETLQGGAAQFLGFEVEVRNSLKTTALPLLTKDSTSLSWPKIFRRLLHLKTLLLASKLLPTLGFIPTIPV